jgi:hypothetical protein
MFIYYCQADKPIDFCAMYVTRTSLRLNPFSYRRMVEAWDTARTIQRVIDDKYPNARLLWQAFQAQAQAARPPRSQSGPLTPSTASSGSRSYSSKINQERSHDQLDKVIQRVIDNRYPETRSIWMCSREEPSSLTTQRTRTFGSGLSVPTSNLPLLNRTDDPRRTGFAVGRPQTAVVGA